MKVVAIVGMSGSGKSEVARSFEQKGFVRIRFGDLTDREVLRRGLELNEENERHVRERLREEHGMAAYARLNLPAIAAARQRSNVVVDGLYSWEEYKLLKEHYGEDFLVVTVYSSPGARQERLSQRPIRPLTVAESVSRDFAEIENLSKGGPIAMADFILINESSLEKLIEETERLIKSLESRVESRESGEVDSRLQTPDSSRPSIDEYFLKVASVVAERSTCLRHHVGAVAVRDKHILSTGYNGAAAGLKDCLELGCLRDAQDIPSGTRHEICRSIHAEQNCIIQASLHGVSLADCTVYCTHTPCILCAKMLVNARIKRFVSFGKYADDSFRELFAEAGIKVDTVGKPSSEITHLE